MSELLKVNVNDHVEKKGQLTYLSWPWAWSEVLKTDPAATWRISTPGTDCPAFFYADGSAMVGVSVTIAGIERMSVLPVMDNRNKAIKQPDSFAINTAIMRCLAKAIAMHGLGLYIYAGEDLPEDEAQAKASAELDQSSNPLLMFAPNVQARIRAAASAAISAFDQGNEWGAYEEVSSLWNKYEEGENRNQIKLALAHIFKPHSALRASLKASAERERNNDDSTK